MQLLHSRHNRWHVLMVQVLFAQCGLCNGTGSFLLISSSLPLPLQSAVCCFTLFSLCTTQRQQGVIFSSPHHADWPLILRISSLLLHIFSMKPLYLFLTANDRLFVDWLLYSRHVTTKEYWCPKRASSIQYGSRKWGTHSLVFSQTLAHGNSKIEIRQWNRGRK